MRRQRIRQLEERRGGGDERSLKLMVGACLRQIALTRIEHFDKKFKQIHCTSNIRRSRFQRLHAS